MSLPSVHIKHYSANVLLMHWTATPHERDIETAFHQILDNLDSNAQITHVIVDITANPQFPLDQTIHHALTVHEHPCFGKWFVLGHTKMAQLIRNALVLLTHKDNIVWVQGYQDIEIHLTQQETSCTALA